MIRIAVCDEDKNIVFSAKKIAEGTLAQCGEAGIVKEYTDSGILVSDVQDGERFDIAILDIEMPLFDGKATAAEIKKMCPECHVIFLTAYDKYAVEAFELQIFRYALKDTYKEKLPKYIKDAITLLTIQQGAMLTLVNGGTAERIPYKKILYIKKEGKYSVVYCTDGRSVAVRKPIGEIIKTLDLAEFVVIDRSCLVNITQIKCISGKEIVCLNDGRMLVSRSNLKEAKEKIVRYFGSIL